MLSIFFIGVNYLLIKLDVKIPLKFTDVKEFSNILLSSVLPLLGFLFTAITIIITIKGLVKPTNNPNNNFGVEIFFNSPKYGILIQVLRTIMWQLFAVFLLLMILKLIQTFIPVFLQINIMILLLCHMSFGISRTLILFHYVINMIANKTE